MIHFTMHDSYTQFMREFAPIHVFAIVIDYNTENTDIFSTKNDSFVMFTFHRIMLLIKEHYSIMQFE